MADRKDASKITPSNPEYDLANVDQRILNYTKQIREKMFTDDITEAMARVAELSGLIAGESSDTAKYIKEFYDDVLLGWESDPNKDPEVITARGGEAQLKDRFEKTDAQLAQNDYVELLKNYNKFDRMQITGGQNVIGVEVTLFNDTQQLTHQFLYNNDEYLIHGRTWVGGLNKIYQPYNGFLYDTLETTGAWVGATSSSSGYTTEVGATFKKTFEVEKDNDGVSVRLTTDNRGGLWTFVLDGLTTNAKQISVNGTGKKTFELFTGLNRGSHTLVGTFMGSDPQNPPATTPARGWVNSLNDPTVLVTREFAQPIKDTLIKAPSNLEFAINFKPINKNTLHMVPFHGEPTAFKIAEPLFKNKGSVIDVTELTYGEYIELEHLVIEQHIYGKHPETPTANSLEIWTTHTLDKNGFLNITGKMKTLEPIHVNNSYTIMGVGKGDYFNRLLTSFNNEIVNNATLYGTNTFLESESDQATSYLFNSSTNKDVAIGYRINQPKQTLRQGESGKDANPSVRTYAQHRSDDVFKVYSRLWNSQLNELPIGYVLKFSGDYIFTQGVNIHDLFAL